MYLSLSILEVSETFAWDNNLSNFKNVGIFTEQLKIVQPQIDNICKQTKNQTNSLKWLRQRKRKLTVQNLTKYILAILKVHLRHYLGV